VVGATRARTRQEPPGVPFPDDAAKTRWGDAARWGAMEFDAATIKALQSIEGNEFCADCGEPNPEWASINLGILVCLQCSGAHRSLGTHISQVRSLKLDNCWNEATVALMKAVGNEKSNAVYEAFVPAFFPRSSDYPEHDGVRQRFIRSKYEFKRFMGPNAVEPSWSVFSKEGFLLKQSKDDTTKWQKRWIVLTEGAMAYYRQQDAETPAGIIKLNANATVYPTGLDLAVCAGPGERVYQLRAPNIGSRRCAPRAPWAAEGPWCAVRLVRRRGQRPGSSRSRPWDRPRRAAWSLRRSTRARRRKRKTCRAARSWSSSRSKPLQQLPARPQQSRAGC